MHPRFFIRTLLISLGFLGGALGVAACHADVNIPSGSIGVIWDASTPESTIQVFTADDLKRLKQASASEMDPTTGKRTHFHGVLLSAIIDRAMDSKSMDIDRRALIDLVILRNPHGTMALIPRSFIVKYPMLLAMRENGKKLDGLKSVAPWTSHPRTRKEGLPLETYFVSGVNEIDLANYRERYGDIFLKERTDPVAMRGEKIFIQGCLGCHDSQPGMVKARNWQGTHPSVNGGPELNKPEFRALNSYLRIYREENTTTAKK